jgi:hypothetical protein
MHPLKIEAALDQRDSLRSSPIGWAVNANSVRILSVMPKFFISMQSIYRKLYTGLDC